MCALQQNMAVLACRHDKVIVELNEVQFWKRSQVCWPSKSRDSSHYFIVFEMATVFSTVFSSLLGILADLKTTSHTSNVHTFTTSPTFILPAFSELLFKIFLRSLTVRFCISSSVKISFSLYLMTILSEDITNNVKQVSETAVILLCLYLPGQCKPQHDVCTVTIPGWCQEL